MEYKRRLPHFDHPGMTFFVTFRLAHSLPVALAQQLTQERQRAIAAVQSDHFPDKSKRIYLIEREYFNRYEGLLDTATLGDRWLTEPIPLAEMTTQLQAPDVLHYLEAYVIMPNHLHLLMNMNKQLPEDSPSPNEPFLLWQAVKRLKGRSAVALNRLRGTSGPVWAREKYDRYIRNEKHFWGALRYLQDNPVKAGLCETWSEYPNTYISPNLLSPL